MSTTVVRERQWNAVRQGDVIRERGEFFGQRVWAVSRSRGWVTHYFAGGQQHRDRMAPSAFTLVEVSAG